MRRLFRLTFLAAILSMGMVAGSAQAQPKPQDPIIFVHGNGDDATKWVPVLWLFESNGYPSNRLFSIRLTDPAARGDDTKPEPFRSSTTDQASELSALVTRVLLETKAHKVILVGSSRGGLTIRNYLKNAGGAAVVSHAILCGTPNHGVMAIDTNLDGEFNGKGHFLQQLNEGSEGIDGVKFLTIRSDKLDKFAQPNVGYNAPALKGAENVVLNNLDHRETAFHPLAFAEMYRFITGNSAKLLKPVAEASPVIGGTVTSFAGAAPTNRPLPGVRFRVFALKPASAERDGEAALETTTTESGSWGPLRVDPSRNYEFVLSKDGRTVSYFMTGLVRGTGILNFRFMPRPATDAVGANLLIHRPQGYLAKDRDPVTVDGAPVAELLPGVPTRDSVAVRILGDRKAGVRVELRGETIYARPAASENELTIAELLWE